MAVVVGTTENRERAVEGRESQRKRLMPRRIILHLLEENSWNLQLEGVFTLLMGDYVG